MFVHQDQEGLKGVDKIFIVRFWTEIYQHNYGM